MTGELPPPTGPPPPGPPPGWYTDPTTGDGYRWWDGRAWTGQTAPTVPDSGRPRSSLIPLGDWFRSVLQLAVRRAGHLFTLTVVLLVPTTLAWGMVSWYQYREAEVLRVDGGFRWTGVIGGPGWVAASVVTWILLLVANLLLLTAVADQTATTLGDAPALWSDSLRTSVRRLPLVLGASLVGAGAVILLSLVSLVAAAVVPPPIGSLIGLAGLVVAVGLAVCLAPAPVAAAVAPRGASPLRGSVAAVRSAFWPVAGRLVFLGIVALIASMTFSYLGQPVAYLAGAASVADLEFTSERIPLGPWLFDPSPAVAAITQVFGALGSGAALALWTVGLTLLYRDLGGPLDLPEPEVDTGSGPTGA